MAEKDHFMRLVTFNVEVCPKPMQDLFIEKAKADTRPGLPFTTLHVFLNHHSATIQHMLNKNYIKVDPRSPTVDISQWDTTMVTSMLQNIFKQSQSNHTFELTSIEKGHIETIRKIRNELQHSSTGAAIEQRDFNNIWIQLESAVYGIANAVGGSCLTEMTEHVNELKFRSIPGQAPVLSILTQWHNEFYDEAKATLQDILKLSKGAKDISRSTIETLEKQTGKIIKKLKTSTIDHMKDQLNIRRSHIDLTDNIEHCPEVDELFSKLNTHHRVLMIDYSRGIDIRVAFAAMEKMGYDKERSVELHNIEDCQHVFCDDVDVVLLIDPFGKMKYDPTKAKAMAEKIDEILDVTKLSKNRGRKDILICSRNESYLGWLEHYDDHELFDEVVKINTPTTEETPITLTVHSRIYIDNLQRNAYDTPAADKAKRMFLDTNTLLITGPNNYNMSVLGAHLMKPYKPQECVVLTDPTEWKYIPLCHDMILKKRSRVISFVMVENFTGMFEFNKDSAYKWMAKFDQMYAAVQAGKLKVVLTCKSDHMMNIKAKLPTHGLFLSRISLSKLKNGGVKRVKLEPRHSLEAREADFEDSPDETDDNSNNTVYRQVPMTLHDRSLEDILTLPGPVIAEQVKQQSRVSPPITVQPAIIAPPLYLSPSLIVSSPIKLLPENEFMPVASIPAMPAVSRMDSHPEPIATFTVGDDFPSTASNYSPKQQQTPPVKPPPPGATHLSSGVGVMLSHGGGGQSSSALDQSKKTELAKTPVSQSKKDVKIKNTGSWASLANLSNTTSSANKKETTNSFELFRKQAEERKERDRVIKQQEEYRKIMKEKEERDRENAERERIRKREEEDALETARHALMASEMENVQQDQLRDDKLKADKEKEIEKERRKEQERRRRQAMYNQIYMNEQSALMARFEDGL